MESELTEEWEGVHSSKDYSIFPPTNHENLYISNHTHHTQSSLSQWSSSSLSSSPFDDTEYDPDSSSPSDENETTGEDDNDSESTIYTDTNSLIVLLPNDLSRWFSVGFEVLCSRAVGIVSWFRNYGDAGRTVWSLGSLAGVVTALIAAAVYRSYRRRCLREGRINQLMILLNQKDERILQLLQQIAKMNAVLVAQHSVS